LWGQQGVLNEGRFTPSLFSAKEEGILIAYQERRHRMPESIVSVEVVCPKCQRTEIVYIPKEQIPKCPDCKTQMVLRELLREGKSY